MHNTPKFTLKANDLPSQGKPYPEVEIGFNTYSFGEILNFNESKMSGVALVDFLEEGVTSNVPFDDLSYDDFLYVSLLRKLNSMPGDQYKIRFACKKCQKVQDSMFSVVGFDDLKVPSFPLIVDLEESDKPLTMDAEIPDFLEFGVLTVGNYKHLAKKDLLSDKVAALAVTVRNMEFDLAYKIIKDATGDLSEALTEVNKMLYHSISDLEISCNDKSCGHLNYVDLTDHKESVILPFRERQSTPSSRIRFGSN